MGIFISREGQQIGNWSEPEIRQFYQAGQLVPSDYYWREGMAEWLPLESLIAQQPSVPGIATAPLPSIPVNKTVKEKDPLSAWATGAPLIIALVFAVLAGWNIHRPNGEEANASYHIGYVIGTMIAIAVIPFLISIFIPRGWRLAVRCILVVMLGSLAWLGSRATMNNAAIQELKDYAEKQREDQRKQLAEKGYADTDPQKTEAELAKIKAMSASATGSSKLMTDTVVEMMGTITAKREAILKVENPTVALGFNPGKLTSLDDIETRRTALQSCHAPIQDMIDYVQNIDTAARNSLTAKGVSEAGISGFLKGMHTSGRFENTAKYWQLEMTILDDFLANMDLFKANWGKWHMDEKNVVFDDPQVAETYKASLQKLEDDTQSQQDVQKALLSAPSGQ